MIWKEEKNASLFRIIAVVCREGSQRQYPTVPNFTFIHAHNFPLRSSISGGNPLERTPKRPVKSGALEGQDSDSGERRRLLKVRGFEINSFRGSGCCDSRYPFGLIYSPFSINPRLSFLPGKLFCRKIRFPSAMPFKSPINVARQVNE